MGYNHSNSNAGPAPVKKETKTIRYLSYDKFLSVCKEQGWTCEFNDDGELLLSKELTDPSCIMAKDNKFVFHRVPLPRPINPMDHAGDSDNCFYSYLLVNFMVGKVTPLYEGNALKIADKYAKEDYMQYKGDYYYDHELFLLKLAKGCAIEAAEYALHVALANAAELMELSNSDYRMVDLPIIIKEDMLKERGTF